MKILIVEDEVELQKSISIYLGKEKYICESANDYRTGENKILSFEYDVVILDITLPDGNGLDLLNLIKTENPETGVLIISAKNSLGDKLNGLDLGADDYITKPFHLAELNSRVNALLRRRKFSGKSTITFNEISIVPESKGVYVNKKHLDLTKKEYELILYFVTNKNRVLTKQVIAEHLWGDSIDLADNFDFVYTHLNNLRKKVKNAGGVDYVKTLYGLGYNFTDQ